MTEENKEEVKPAKPEPIVFKELTTTQLEALDWLVDRLEEIQWNVTDWEKLTQEQRRELIRDGVAASKDFLDAFKEYDVKLEPEAEACPTDEEIIANIKTLGGSNVVVAGGTTGGNTSQPTGQSNGVYWTIVLDADSETLGIESGNGDYLVAIPAKAWDEDETWDDGDEYQRLTAVLKYPEAMECVFEITDIPAARTLLASLPGWVENKDILKNV